MRRRGLVVSAFLLASVAMAQQPKSSPRKLADVAYARQMAQEGHDCANARTQRDENECIVQVRQTADNDFRLYYKGLALALAPDPSNIKRLDEAHASWVEYRDKTCAAIHALYSGGSIQESATARCEIQLTRSRMRDLEALYETPLHH